MSDYMEKADAQIQCARSGNAHFGLVIVDFNIGLASSQMRFISGEVVPGLLKTETYVKKINMPKKYSEILPIKGNENRVAECYSLDISGFLQTSNERPKGEIVEGYRGPTFKPPRAAAGIFLTRTNRGFRAGRYNRLDRESHERTD